MAGIKHCLDERKKIKHLIKEEETAEAEKANALAEKLAAGEQQVEKIVM